MAKQSGDAGRSWEVAHRGVRVGLLVVGSSLVMNLLYMAVSGGGVLTALLNPAGWLLGLFVGPAIHWVLYARSPWKQADDHYKRGVKAYEAEQPDEAIAEFTKALDLSGGEGKPMKWDAHAYAYRAGAYAVLEDIGRAVSDLEKAQSLTRDPDLTAHVESQLQELREQIGHGGAQGVTRRGASVISRTGG